MRKPVLSITMGDPGGIGPEIILKALERFPPSNEILILVVGTDMAFQRAAKTLKRPLHWNTLSSYEYSALRPDKINFLDVTLEAQNLFTKITKSKTSQNDFGSPEAGKVSLKNACMTLAALKAAATLASLGMIDGIATAPVNKTSMRLIDPKFHGHTEFLAQASGTKKFAMMFVSDRLKVTLATIHVPIKKVSRLITSELVYEKISLTHDFLKNRLRISNPRIAVCALNPHGKETGTEDEAEISPAVRKAGKKNIQAVGPLSADQLFFDAYEGRYDAVISMYHDQGLGPFKMVAFRDGVNVTLGLPFIRTSPDHGTAFDIAYQGKAESSSMEAAICLAQKLISKGE